MKKAAGIFIIGAMLVFMCTGAFAAFPDMPAGEDGAVLQRAVDNGLISGFEDGTIQPSTPITRAQMATIMSRAMNASDVADLSKFNDVKQDDWYYDAMAKAVQMKAFKGDDKSNLNPNSTISRQEGLIVLSRIFNMAKADLSVLNKYSDAASVASWAQAEVSKVVGEGYLPEMAALRPLEPMTRLEFAQIMDKIVVHYIDSDGEYTEFADGGNVLVRAQNVKFTGIKNVKNFFVGDGVTGNVEFADCVADSIVIRGGSGKIVSGTYKRTVSTGKGLIVAPMVDVQIQ